MRLAPAEGSVNLTSAWLIDAKLHNRTSAAVVHPETARKGECIIAWLRREACNAEIPGDWLYVHACMRGMGIVGCRRHADVLPAPARTSFCHYPSLAPSPKGYSFMTRSPRSPSGRPMMIPQMQIGFVGCRLDPSSSRYESLIHNIARGRVTFHKRIRHRV